MLWAALCKYMLTIMNTIYKQSSLMHGLLMVRERGAIFYSVEKHSSGAALESERDCRFPRQDLQISPYLLK